MTLTDPDAVASNPSDNESFADVLAARISRRSLLGGGLAAAGTVALAGVAGLADAVPAAAEEPGNLLGFEGIEPSSLDGVVVPPGYTATPLIRWGDPVSNGPAFKPDGSNTAAEQAQQWGMHNDGLVYFPLAASPIVNLPFLGPFLASLLGGLLGGSQRGLVVQNHEYVDEGLLFPDGIATYSPEKAAKVLAAHGVSVIEVGRKGRGPWGVVRPSRYARRVTGSTPITIGGPAAGHALLRTAADPTGTEVLGTLNNCAMGYTPWGTYLACEENFNGYFKKDGALTDLEKRYGIAPFGAGLRLHTVEPRFKVDTEPNEPNRFGWVVEINPFDPRSTPVKRTALGRIKHEGATVQETADGRVVVYMGDDQAFEYIYRYESRLPWKRSFARGIHPLDDGTLSVARFNADGSGEWLPLTPDNPALAGWTLPEILVKTRLAADALGATKMDRPEWIETFPQALTVIATLTNNSGRGVGSNPPVDASNPRAANRFGQIIRWTYANDWSDTTFTWDLFALAGNPEAEVPDGSTIVGDRYGSPDGLFVAPSGRLWIQTDVSTSTIDASAYAGFGNNQMLCADPVTKETRRFLVGPKQCEITGCVSTPDERTLFVGIQHPGEPANELTDPAAPLSISSWPDGPTGGRPRSSLLVITKDDGGPIGS